MHQSFPCSPPFARGLTECRDSLLTGYQFITGYSSETAEGRDVWSWVCAREGNARPLRPPPLRHLHVRWFSWRLHAGGAVTSLGLGRARASPLSRAQQGGCGGREKVSTPLVPLATIPSPSLEASRSHLVHKIRCQKHFVSDKRPWIALIAGEIPRVAGARCQGEDHLCILITNPATQAGSFLLGWRPGLPHGFLGRRREGRGPT